MRQLEKQNQFVKDLGVHVMSRVEEAVSKEDQIRVFMFIYNKAFNQKKGDKAPSYTDSILCALIYKYRHNTTGLKLLTANHRDVPQSLFDRDELITIDIEGELRTEAIYSLSENKLQKSLSNV